MALLSFCGVLTLQVGTAILATIFIAWPIFIFQVNVYDFAEDEVDDWYIPIIVIAFFIILMLIIGIVVFFSAYNESRKLCMVSIALIVFLLLLYIILSVISFLNKPNLLEKICVHNRCPESFWISSLSYRGNWRKREDISEKTYFMRNSLNLGVSNMTNIDTNMANVRPGSLEYKTYSLSLNSKGGLNLETDDDDRSAEYIFGKHLVGAILIFVINLIYFVFAIIILWSYNQELKWMSFFYDAPSGTNVGPQA